MRTWLQRTRILLARVKRRIMSNRLSPPRPVPEPPLESAPPETTDDTEVIESLEQLDEKLQLIDEAYKISDDAMREVFQSFRLRLPASTSGTPWSNEYRDEQFELYHRLSTRGEYRIENETSGYEVDSRIPFPYYT